MSLVKCKVCEKEVAASAPTCPNCGVTNPGISIPVASTGGSNKPILFILLGTLVFFCLVAIRPNKNSSTDSAAAQAQPEANEAVVQSVADGAPIATTHSNCYVPNKEGGEAYGLILNLNSLLCAEVVKVCPLTVRDSVELTCIEYRGGSAKKTYILNTETSVAFEN